MGLDTIEFVMWVEEEFGIEIPDRDAAELVTVSELCRYVANRIPPKKSGDIEGEIFDKVSRHLNTEFGVPLCQILPDARFVQDLGLD